MIPAHVYLIHLAGYHKIGASADPESRLRAFQNLPFGDTSLIHSFPSKDAFLVEFALHERFKDKRVCGEWFTLGQEDIACFCTVTICDTPATLPSYLIPNNVADLRPNCARKLAVEFQPLFLRLARQRRGWTQWQLADAAGMSRVYVGQLERRINVPTMSTVERLAKALNLNPSELLSPVPS